MGIAHDIMATPDYLRDPPTHLALTPLVYDGIFGCKTTMRNVVSEMMIMDGCNLAGDFDLEREGYTLVSHPCSITDLFGRSQTGRTYCEDVADLGYAASGAFAAITRGTNMRFGPKKPDYVLISEQMPAFSPYANFTAEEARAHDCPRRENIEARVLGSFR